MATYRLGVYNSENCFLGSPNIYTTGYFRSTQLKGWSKKGKGQCIMSFFLKKAFIFFRHASVSSTYPCQSVRWSVRHTFEFPLPLNISVQQSSLMSISYFIKIEGVCRPAELAELSMTAPILKKLSMSAFLRISGQKRLYLQFHSKKCCFYEFWSKNVVFTNFQAKNIVFMNIGPKILYLKT